jgi:prepilin-type processing-associated H-X9-DG protein
MPFIHARYMNAENMSVIAPSGLGDTQFEAGDLRDLTAVPEKTLRNAKAINVLFLDGHRRAAIFCDPEKCRNCKV